MSAAVSSMVNAPSCISRRRGTKSHGTLGESARAAAVACRGKPITSRGARRFVHILPCSVSAAVVRRLETPAVFAKDNDKAYTRAADKGKDDSTACEVKGRGLS